MCIKSRWGLVLESFFKELRAPTTLVSWAVGTGILGFIGPFGMAETTSLSLRLIYWLVIIGAALLLSLSVRHLALAYLSRLHLAYIQLICGASFSALFTPFLIWFNSTFYPQRADSMLPPLQLFAFVMVVFVGIGLLILVVEKQISAARKSVLETVPITAPLGIAGLTSRIPEAFRARLEPHLRQGELYRLAMQDHYVEVHTSAGSQLVLMRMSDAISELSPIEGMQVHRSHWVASAAVTGTVRRDGRLLLETRDGAEIPVSRSYRTAVRDAGLV